ncbi:MAG TPA: response regulator [Nitrospiria bacterium]|nr:response regulator [Nitrospiria bacterium]
MILTCPGCKNNISIDEIAPNDTIEKVCEHCHSSLRIKTKIEVDLIMKEEVRSVPPPVETKDALLPDEEKVLVAIEGSATREIIKDVLDGSGIEVIESSTGREALFMLKKFRPAVAVIDVGLPQIFGFEVCEIIKKSPVLKGTSVILVASIYDKARYKRAPESLYGADDYIERHHIKDNLFLKIKRLIGIKKRGESAVTEEKRQAVEEAAAPLKITPISVGEKVLKPVGRIEEAPIETRSVETSMTQKNIQTVIREQPQLPGDPDEHDAAKRLARIILSDIALYNQKAVDEGIRNDTFHQILKDDLEEGRRLFEKRVSKEIRDARDYYGEAIGEFIRKRKKLSN